MDFVCSTRQLKTSVERDFVKSSAVPQRHRKVMG